MYELIGAGRAVHRQFYVLHTATPTSRPHTHLNYRCAVRNVLQIVGCSRHPGAACCLGQPVLLRLVVDAADDDVVLDRVVRVDGGLEALEVGHGESLEASQ
jgi:hypothetical protein